jgi:hypothetical protein
MTTAGAAGGEPPRGFDGESVRAALAHAETLVLALGAPEDLGGPPLVYLRELEHILDRAFAGAGAGQESRESVASVMYGMALFGLGGLTVASEAASLTRERVLQLLRECVEGWLELHT